MKDDGGHGKQVERLIADLCKIQCTESFLFSNPKFRKGKHEKELADVLIFPGRQAVIIQVKSASPISQVWHDDEKAVRWVQKKTEEALGQLRGSIRAIVTRQIQSVINSGIGEIAVVPERIERYYGILVIDMPPGRPMLSIGPLETSGIQCPYLVLAPQEFSAFVNELSTLGDLFDYLDFRHRLLTAGTKIICDNELDLLGTIRSHRLDLEDLEKAGEHGHLFIDDDGVWDEFQQHPQVEARRSADKISYLIDHVIEQASQYDEDLSREIGQGLPMTFEGDASRMLSLEAKRRLSMLDRTARRWVARKWLEKARLVDDQVSVRQFGHVQPVTREATVFAVSTLSRESRVSYLATIADLMRASRRYCDPLMIVTDPEFRAFDFVMATDSPDTYGVQPSEEDLAFLDRMFRPESKIDEFQFPGVASAPRVRSGPRKYKKRNRRSR